MVTDTKAVADHSDGSMEMVQRKPWSSPEVIVSVLRDTEGHVTRFTDGSTPIFGPYGS